MKRHPAVQELVEAGHKPATEIVAVMFEGANAMEKALTKCIDFFKANQVANEDYRDLIAECSSARAIRYSMPADEGYAASLLTASEVNAILRAAAEQMRVAASKHDNLAVGYINEPGSVAFQLGQREAFKVAGSIAEYALSDDED